MNIIRKLFPSLNPKGEFDMVSNINHGLYPWTSTTTECLMQLKSADFAFSIKKSNRVYTYKAEVDGIVYTNAYNPAKTLSQAVIGLYLDVFGLEKLMEVQRELKD